MGQFRITIVAVGGHGCQRELGEGREVSGCRNQGCPDCATRQFAERLKREQYCSIESAKIEHWPGTPGQVTDDLVTKVRGPGQFFAKPEVGSGG